MIGQIFDSGGFEELSATLSFLERRIRDKVMLDSLTAGARVLQENTKTELKKALGESSTRRGARGVRGQENHSPMIEGVSVIRDMAYNTAIVSIMRDFRLKWFEKGTDDRWAGGRKTKGGYYPGSRNASNYRGSIAPKRFFYTARGNFSAIEEAVVRKLNQGIDKNI